jgi:hypothetical protein
MGRLTKRIHVKTKWNKRITKLIAKYIAVSKPGIRENVNFMRGKVALIILKNRLDDARTTALRVWAV